MTIKIGLIITLFSLAAFSCSKDRNCTCDYTAEYPTQGTPGTDVIPVGKMSKSEAADSCSSLQASYENNPYYITVSCYSN